jgi:acetylornithine deacetylase
MSAVLDLLCELIAIPSANPFGRAPVDQEGEVQIVAYLRERLERLGLDCAVMEGQPARPNLVARLAGAGGPALIFESHTDTVSINGMADPFNPVVKDGRVYGRGACDDKASLAAMVVALEATARRGTPPGDIYLLATADEEFSGSGVQYVMDQGVRAAMAIAGEPTSLELVIAHKGALRVRIFTYGRAAHSSEPEKGENAIYRMAPVIQCLQEYALAVRERPAHPLVGHPAASIGLIEGGQAPNIVPAECSVVLDRRLLPAEDAVEVQAEIEQWLTDHLPDTPHLVTELLYGVGMETPAASPVVTRCAAALDRVRGSHVITGAQYGTDASRMSHAGIPAVVLGPGDIAQAHTNCEWVDLTQVEQAVDVYREIMWPS